MRLITVALVFILTACGGSSSTNENEGASVGLTADKFDIETYMPYMSDNVEDLTGTWLAVANFSGGEGDLEYQVKSRSILSIVDDESEVSLYITHGGLDFAFSTSDALNPFSNQQDITVDDNSFSFLYSVSTRLEADIVRNNYMVGQLTGDPTLTDSEVYFIKISTIPSLPEYPDSVILGEVSFIDDLLNNGDIYTNNIHLMYEHQATQLERVLDISEEDREYYEENCGSLSDPLGRDSEPVSELDNCDDILTFTVLETEQNRIDLISINDSSLDMRCGMSADLAKLTILDVDNGIEPVRQVAPQLIERNEFGCFKANGDVITEFDYSSGLYNISGSAGSEFDFNLGFLRN